ncbi:sce7725 family protein [uncultured Christiangramia sp.]|uniref:sce7725 family protein n=1 Tax=Christiangramia sp. 3-2217-3z TaxID=3417564 RepID=UPI00260D6A5B|nr:sce7725 family protein [uncultured Christiangramia sp.]
MYYPLFRARQFELIALRELTKEGKLENFILPILEPVKESHNNMNLAIRQFVKFGQQAYLILNPEFGERSGDHNYYLDYINTLEGETLIPAFYYRNNKNYIEESIQNYNLNNVMLLCENDINNDDTDFREIVNFPQITSITVNDPGRNRSLDRFIKNLNKNYIRLDDLFEKQVRNSDFLDIQEHRFSEEHLYYSDEGYTGFSDYTVLPSEFMDGGSTPRAVVIHLTYLNEENQIWIRHFTSNTNDSIANVQGKFAEAAEKAVMFCRENNLNNSAIQELENYYNHQHYPGLGVVKKIAMKNHLLIIQEFLSNR